MGMAEHCYEYGYSINDIKYCEMSGDTIYPGDKKCRYCTNESVSYSEVISVCKQLKAYQEGKCKLKYFR